MKLTLTSRFISHQLTCPPGKRRIEYCDTKIPGLFIEVRATSEGQGTFYLRYRKPDAISGISKTRYAKIGRTMDITLSQARKQAQQLRAGILLGNYPGTDKADQQQCMTFQEFFQEKYLPYCRPRKRSWLDDQKLFTTRLNQQFGHLPLNKISRHSIQQFHSDLRESGLAPATCYHYLGLLIRCFRLAVEWSLLDTSPATGLKKFNADNSRNVFLSPEELKRLLHILDTDSARMPCLAVKLMLLTGSRKGEALHARWSDIDMDAGVWLVQAENSKSRKRRSIPLGTAAQEVLEELSTLRCSEYVFTNSRRPEERLKSIDKVWQRLRLEAGPPDLVLHGMRHHYASMLAASGVDLYRIQRILGHASPVQTQRYSHLSGSALQDAANTVNDYLDKALKSQVDTSS